jgi:DNA polymerase III alpha subunit (gram-positive type)
MDGETRYFCLECLGTEFYIATRELKDGTDALLHMCKKCHLRMEYSGTDHI